MKVLRLIIQNVSDFRWYRRKTNIRILSYLNSNFKHETWVYFAVLSWLVSRCPCFVLRVPIWWISLGTVRLCRKFWVPFTRRVLKCTHQVLSLFSLVCPSKEVVLYLSVAWRNFNIVGFKVEAIFFCLLLSLKIQRRKYMSVIKTWTEFACYLIKIHYIFFCESSVGELTLRMNISEFRKFNSQHALIFKSAG